MRLFMTKAASAVILAAAAFSTVAAEAAPATATGTARARILKQVTITNTSDLDFGTIVPATAAGTVGVSTGGARTCGAGLTCTGTTSAANFNITGTVGTVVTVTAPASVTMTSGTNSMTATLTRSAATVTLAGGAVNGTVQVGGTLNVAATQADGTYSGTFNVTIDYQ